MDLNQNGFLDEVELQLGVYEVYNLVNKRFPGWSDPPSREQILKVLGEYDVNKDSQARHASLLYRFYLCG